MQNLISRPLSRLVLLSGAVGAGLATASAADGAMAAAFFSSDGTATSIAGDFLAAAMLLGTVIFLALTAFLFLKAAHKARRAEMRAAEEMANLTRQLDLARSIMAAEPQALVVCDKDEAPRLVTHTLAPTSGVPAKLRSLMRFAAWAEPEAAHELDMHLNKLRETGEPFSLIVKTASGATVEVEGRASGNCYYLKFRDLAERRVELANLMTLLRSQSAELAAKHALFDALPMPVWFRGADGRLTWVNRAYLASVEAARVEDVVESQIELLEQQQRKLIDAQLAKGETFHQRLQTVVGGGRRTFDTVAVPLNQGSAGAAIDVAPLESAQDQLTRQIAEHARTLDRVATAVAIFGPDQRLAFFNQAYWNLWGLDADWLASKPKFGEILDRLRQSRQLPEQADYRKWRADQLKAFEQTESREDLWHLPDGRSVLVITDQRPDGSLTQLYDDVTERYALESRYNALMHVQRETLDNLREGVAVFGSDGRLKLFNPAFVSLWRLNVETLNREPHIEDIALLCKPLEGEDDPWASAKQAITSVNETRQAFEGQLSRADGIVIDYAGVPLPDGGTLLAYIDITDRKRVEQALVERNEALEAADRLKNAFISHISRELRTPLTNIIGFSELLANPRIGILNAKQREYLNDIRSSSVALLSIINDILDLAVIDAGALELTLAPVSIKEVIDAAELGVRDRLSKNGLKLDVQIDPNVGEMLADGQRLTQILFNLLSNAIGFSEEGSIITLNCRRENGQIAFTVQDMGCGIPEEFQKTVFDRFESRSLGSRHRGAGLGLSLVKSLVEMHGGTIRLRSAPGAGTTVTVLIPENGPRRLLPETDEKTSARAASQAARGSISAIFS